MKNSKKGFTLVELLIVIAIIAILAGIVLTALSTSRNKAKIAAFKSEVSGLQAKGLLACDGGTASSLLNLPSNLKYTTYITGSQYCTGEGTFAISVNSNDSNLGSCNTSNTVVNDSAATFPVGC